MQQNSLKEKIKLAILTLKNANGVSQGESELISDRLRNEFFATGKVDVMERDQMQEVLKEQGFQQSGTTCSDEGCMVELGRMLGVKRLVAGSIGKLGTMFMVNVRSINIETGKVEKVVSEDVKGNIEDVVAIIPLIARKMTGTASMSQQKVIEIKTEIIQQEAVDNKSVNVATLEELPCDGSYFMERVSFSKAQLGFQIEESTAREIDEMLIEELSDELDKDVIPASRESILASTCKTRVIRIKLNSYKTRPAAFKQFEGTANVAISIYSTPASKKPLVSVNIEGTGERHWGNDTPLTNAFEEITDDLDHEFCSKVKKFLK